MKKNFTILVFAALTIIAASIATANVTLTMNIEGQGIVTPDEGEWEYSEGSQVILIANPIFGWSFIGWGGTVEDFENSTTTIFLNKNETVIAIFQEEELDIDEGYFLTINTQGQGNISLDVGTYEFAPGQNITIVAIPEQGWQFVEWIGDVNEPLDWFDDLNETNNISNMSFATITMNTNHTIIAVFEQENLTNVTNNITANVTNNVTNNLTNTTNNLTNNITDNLTGNMTGMYTLTINIQGEGTTTPTQGMYEYENETEVRIVATPNQGWQFIEWDGDVDNNDDRNTTIVLDSDKTITAIFEEIELAPGEVILVVNVSGNGTTIPGEGVHVYEIGENVTIVAIPAVGAGFDTWDGNVTNSNVTTTTVTMDGNQSVTAVFDGEVGLGNFWVIVLIIVVVIVIIALFAFIPRNTTRGRRRN